MIRYFSASLVTLSLMMGLVFGVLMGCMVFLDTVNLAAAMAVTVVFNLLVFLVSPWMTDLMLRWVNGITWWTPDELKMRHPELHTLMNDICKTHGFGMPYFGYINDGNPTAFTYGILRQRARVVMTQGIFDYLSVPQAKAVLAHELGHIRNYDFAVMTAASLAVQLLYQLYAFSREMSKKFKGSGSKKGGNPFPILMLISYVAYVLSTYLLLYLSRTREYLADAFAAKHTSAADLAGALARIAYGIIDKTDTPQTVRLLQQTRQLGIMDVNNARQAGMLVHNDKMSVAQVSESMLFDVFNPWAALLELSSTHPLTGKRLRALQRQAALLGQPFPDIDVDRARERVQLDTRRLWRNFGDEIAMTLMPWLLAANAGMYGFLYLDWKLAWILAGLGFLLGQYGLAFYRMPAGPAEKVDAIDLVCDPYASPIRGRRVALEGQAVGRANPGSIFSEDVMFQDRTALVPLDFNSWLGALGNLFIALKRVGQLLKQPAHAIGWYYRGMSGYVLLREYQAGETTLKARPYLAAAMGYLVWPVVICAIIYEIVAR